MSDNRDQEEIKIIPTTEFSDDSEEEIISLTLDDIDFDKLNIEIDELAKNIPDTTPEAVDDLFDKPDELNEQTESNSDTPQENSSMLDFNEDEQLSPLEESAPDEEVEIEQKAPPVIELTEAMLDEPEQPLLPELDIAQERNDESLKNRDVEDLVETPEFTDIESSVIAGAEEIRAERDEGMQESVSRENGTVSMLPAILSVVGIIVGGFGAWLAWSAHEQIEELEYQFVDVISMIESEHAHDKADMEMRLSNIEQNFTVTLPKTTIQPVTPQTDLSETVKENGGWVINISSHATESAAQKERARLQAIGLNAKAHAVKIKDRVWHRVQIIGFSSKDAAKAELRDAQKRSGVKDAWIGEQ